jgi:hypothetical protein
MAESSLDPFGSGLEGALGNANAVDGTPLGREISAAQRERINSALTKFRQVIGEGSDCMAVAGYLGYLSRERTRSTEDEIREACRSHFQCYPSSPADKTIHLVLDSGGGSLDSAFRTARFLRRFAQRLRVYVPRRAKSAATLIAVSADEIVMSPFAELGPLDTQIRDPRNPTKDISALDCYQSVDYVREFGLQTVPAALSTLLLETQARIPLSELITTSTNFALGGVSPMLSTVKALDFGGWGRTLKIGETYARALLRDLGTEDADRTAQRIAKKLVYAYPHHPYPIDIKEASSLGLQTAMMGEEEYEAAMNVIDACNDFRFVGFANGIEPESPRAANRLGDTHVIYEETRGNGSLQRPDPAVAVTNPTPRAEWVRDDGDTEHTDPSPEF